jgi:hypothetical protein
MSGGAPARPGTDPAVRLYYILALAAAGVLALGLFERSGLVGLIPPLLGCAGLFGHWRSTPALVLATLTAVLWFFTWNVFGVPELFAAEDLILCSAVLAFLLAQSRLLSLTEQAMPRDPWWPALFGPADEPVRRPPRLIDGSELPAALIVVGACVVAAQAVWWLAVRWNPAPDPELGRRLGFLPGAWRFGVIALLIGLSALAVTTVLRQLRRWRWSADEAALVIQDAMWEETRREQRRNARWVAWLTWRRDRPWR